MHLFRSKDVRAVRRIQDAMKCCGFRSNRDMAWPFVDKEHKNTACEEAFGRNRSCEQLWGRKEHMVLGLFVMIGAVGLAVVVSGLCHALLPFHVVPLLTAYLEACVPVRLPSSQGKLAGLQARLVSASKANY